VVGVWCLEIRSSMEARLSGNNVLLLGLIRVKQRLKDPHVTGNFEITQTP
jgi:hypothetical protein